MNRAGLIVVLLIAALAGLIFSVDPELDLALSRPFFDVTMGSEHFGLRIEPLFQIVHRIGWLSTVGLMVSAGVGLIIKLVLPRARLWMSTRAMTFLLVTALLGPGVLANVVLKDHWARSRPIDVVELGGVEKFVPWWDPRGECRRNCSFVSGDVSAAFWTVAAAALAPPGWRALAYGGALVFGIAASLWRVAAGAHFVTDAVFSGVLMFLLVWLMHGIMIRWPRTRLTEAEAEGAIELVALWWRGIVVDLLRKPRTDP